MVKNGVFWHFWSFLRAYYVKSTKNRGMKFLAFSFITDISNILKKEINSSCISSYINSENGDFTNPTKTSNLDAGT